MKNIRILFVIVLLLILSPAAMAAEEALPFSDIEGHWAAEKYLHLKVQSLKQSR